MTTIFILLLFCLHSSLTWCLTDDTSTEFNSNRVNIPTTNPVTKPTVTKVDNSVHMSSPAGTCDYDFIDGSPVPADDVFIIDRSSSVNKEQFDNGMKFIRSLILKRFVLSPEVNRIAIISVAKEVVTHVDYISADDDDVAAECEFFHPGGVFDGIQYDTAVEYMGTKSLIDIVNNATRILQSSRTRSVKRLWLITDFHGYTDTPHYRDISGQVPGIQIYGVGANVHARDEKGVIHDRFCNLTTGRKSCGCGFRYLNDHTSPELSWMGVVNSLDTETLEEKKDPERSHFVQVTNESVCQAHDYSCTGRCYCRRFLTTHDSVRCRYRDNDDFDDDEGLSTLTMILIALLSIFILVTIVLTIVLLHTQCRSKGQKQNKPPLPYFPSVRTVTTTTSDLSYEIEGYLVPSNWYSPTHNISRRNSESDVSPTGNSFNENIHEVVNVYEIVYQPTHKYINVDSSETMNESIDSGVVTNSIDRKANSGIDNTLYQLSGDSKSNGVKPKKNKLFIRNKQKSAISYNIPVEHAPAPPTTPHTYHEIVEPYHNNNYSKRHKRQSSHPYVEILPRNSNYEPVVIKFNAPPSSHSYEKFCFPTKVNDVNKDHDDTVESGYASTTASTNNVTQGDGVKDDNIKQTKSIRTGGKKVKEIANMFTENSL